MAFIRKHPLLVVLIVAVLLRVPAVLYSKGFAFNDDHYETVDVAYGWLHHGFLDDSGHMFWKLPIGGPVARFPLYTLFLLGIMKLCRAFGVESLDQMMYAIRAAHALLSLISVWGAFKLVELVTRSWRWAIAGGLVVAAHFAMPFLAVRNLIEMVGGHFWLIAMLFLYCFERDKKHGWLFAAGVMSGFAWMFRFQLLFAFVAIPVALLWLHRSIRPAVSYTFGLVAMIFLAGMADWWLIGTFMASSINHVAQGLREGALYGTTVLIYPLVLLAFFIPPFSFVGFGLMFRRSFFMKHLPLAASSLTFIAIHTLVSNRQERFMVAIAPVLCAGLVLAVYQHWKEHGYFARHKRWFWGLTGVSLAINLVLLPVFTLNYAHKGVVESLVNVQQTGQPPNILLVSPGVSRIYPFNYAGFNTGEMHIIRDWSDFGALRSDSSGASSRTGFAVLFPSDSADLARMSDSVDATSGTFEPYVHIRPSLVDRALRALNPKYNRSQEAWVFRRSVGRTP